jgi:erythritol transport system ATP-binding protein
MSNHVNFEPALHAVQVSKVYPGTVALHNVDFEAKRGAVNILIGANGAGKSTLMRILAGIEMPTSGELSLNGESLIFNGPREAAEKGIAMVHQELSLMPNLTITENIFAGRELRKFGMLVDRVEQRRRTAELLKSLNLGRSPDTEVGDLAVGQKQLVEIARALAHRASVLILDEPTSALSNAETRTLFRAIGELKQNGVTIIYISHRLQELLEIGDFFTVLRDGRVAGTATRDEVSKTWIVETMIGKRLGDVKNTASIRKEANVLRIEHLTVEKEGRNCIHDLSFKLAPGEVVGLYGLLGAGRSELLETLVGQRRESNGQVFIKNRLLNGSSTVQCIRHGIYLVPEDRQSDGLIPDMSIRGNASLAQIARLTRAGVLSLPQERRETDNALSSVRLKPCNLRLPITTLSGGNQQKTLLARALLTGPAVLLLDEPTRGVDVGAKAEIYTLIRQLAANGLGVLFATSEGQEIRDLADRVLVLSRGVLTAAFDASEATDEKLLIAASATTQQRTESAWVQ